MPRPIVLLLTMVATAAAMNSWSTVPFWNAVPTGNHTTVDSLAACQHLCLGACTQFSFNNVSKHCYLSKSNVWDGTSSDHIISGCDLQRVHGCVPPMDGVLRDAGDGRLDALLPPPYPSSHASMIEQSSEGRLHLAWFSGSKEGAAGVSMPRPNPRRLAPCLLRI